MFTFKLSLDENWECPTLAEEILPVDYPLPKEERHGRPQCHQSYLVCSQKDSPSPSLDYVVRIHNSHKAEQWNIATSQQKNAVKRGRGWPYNPTCNCSGKSEELFFTLIVGRGKVLGNIFLNYTSTLVDFRKTWGWVCLNQGGKSKRWTL